jgi:hypothetical protein
MALKGIVGFAWAMRKLEECEQHNNRKKSVFTDSATAPMEWLIPMSFLFIKSILAPSNAPTVRNLWVALAYSRGPAGCQKSNKLGE